MLVFDAEQYRKNRKAGLRGQGPKPVTTKQSKIVTSFVKPVSKKAIKKHTKRARKAEL